MIPLDLAPLSPEERAHEQAVVARIRQAVEEAGGWLSFAHFMELALYAPGLGYYAAGAHKLGAGGDFVTAPELSAVFGRCIATQCAEVLGHLGEGDILELGAGTGILAAEVLGELARVGRLPGRYWILEPSPDLRQRQQDCIARLPPALRARVSWLDGVPAQPFRGVLLANEVLDALPVERFRIAPDGSVEALGVAMAANTASTTFRWQAGPASATLDTEIAEINADLERPLPAGFVSEACVALAPWLAEVTRPLAAGVALLIDYGWHRRAYYGAERAAGTLSCYHRQRRHEDPFVNVGLQDLTASVDFTRAALAAVACGLDVAGYTTQAHFLLGLDFEQHLARLRAEQPADAPLLGRRAARLVLPDDMGETFKCLALTRGYAPPLRGLALRDFTPLL